MCPKIKSESISTTFMTVLQRWSLNPLVPGCWSRPPNPGWAWRHHPFLPEVEQGYVTSLCSTAHVVFVCRFLPSGLDVHLVQLWNQLGCTGRRHETERSMSQSLCQNLNLRIPQGDVLATFWNKVLTHLFKLLSTDVVSTGNHMVSSCWTLLYCLQLCMWQIKFIFLLG